MMITLYCVNVMRSVVTEKTSRVMELMVAAVKPQQLMAGKILGVGGAALLQIGIWLVMGGLALAYRDAMSSSAVPGCTSDAVARAAAARCR